MDQSHFIFSPGNWIGEGKISLSESVTELNFYAKWTIREAANSEVEAVQTIEMQGGQEQLKNRFSFAVIDKEKFTVTLENNLVYAMRGTGVIEPKRVAWEFRGRSEFEGFEVYQLQENGDYFFHAEYVSQDQLRSVIEGKIWKKNSKKKC